MMEEQHEEMDGQRQLRPDLWQTLPDYLIDTIIQKVLADLPFSRIFSFCGVFKPWTDILLSTHYILYFHLDSCMIFNPRRGLWSISLKFCVAEGLRLQEMLQVSCGEGLLLLSSPSNHDVVVCNPLTRRYKRFREPAGGPFYDAEFGRRMIADTTWRVAFRHMWDPSLGSSRSLLTVKVDVYSDTGYFQLTVLKIDEDSKLESNGAVCVKDSRCSTWEFIGGAPHNLCFLVEPTLFSGGSIILGFAACPGGFKVLTYDVGLKQCAWILNIQTIRSIPNATSSTGKTLIATLSCDSELEFFQVRDTGHTLTLTRSPFPPSKKGPLRSAVDRVQLNNTASSLRAPESFEFFNIVRLESGDIVHYMVLANRIPSGKVESSVWTHNRVNSSDRISNWKEWTPSGLDSGHLPSARHFYIFKPSFLSPR